MSWAIIIFIIIMGLLLLLVEFFLIPGTTIIGIIGGILIILSISMAYSTHGIVAGNYTLAISGTASLILLIVGFRAVASQKYSLNENISERVNLLENKTVRPGDEGITFNDLRPNGKAVINDEKVEVYSMGQYVKKGEKVKVVKITGNKIFVKTINNI